MFEGGGEADQDLQASLDDALEATFPASDPVSLTPPRRDALDREDDQ